MNFSNRKKKSPLLAVLLRKTKTKKSILRLKLAGEPTERFFDWRRGRDSNPRDSLWPPNRSPGDPVMTTSVPLLIYLINNKPNIY